MKDIAADTSTLLYLVKTGLFRNVSMRSKIAVSNEIARELENGKEKGYKDARMVTELIEQGRVEIIAAKETKTIQEEFGLNPEDASIIALSREKGLRLATEDDRIADVAELIGIELTSVGGILYELFRLGDIKFEQALVLLEILEKFGYKKENILLLKEKILTQGEKNG